MSLEWKILNWWTSKKIPASSHFPVFFDTGPQSHFIKFPFHIFRCVWVWRVGERSFHFCLQRLDIYGCKHVGSRIVAQCNWSANFVQKFLEDFNKIIRELAREPISWKHALHSTHTHTKCIFCGVLDSGTFCETIGFYYFIIANEFYSAKIRCNKFIVSFRLETMRQTTKQFLVAEKEWKHSIRVIRRKSGIPWQRIWYVQNESNTALRPILRIEKKSSAPIDKCNMWILNGKTVECKCMNYQRRSEFNWCLIFIRACDNLINMW